MMRIWLWRAGRTSVESRHAPDIAGCPATVEFHVETACKSYIGYACPVAEVGEADP
jgi:hypothetical protein